MISKEMEKLNRIAQWAFDTRPILGRFHLWLEDVENIWVRGKPPTELNDSISFVDASIERLFIMTAAVTALGTRLFGRYGEGANLDKKGLNQVKKDADAISAYAMSESLWYLSRSLPENHAVMVCLGEGLMPKGGETPEMGSNPMLGFGRVYARPQVAKFVDKRVQRLINDPDYTWKKFYTTMKNAGITIWGAAIDTLENTSRFARGAETGPMTVLHIFNQPLTFRKPYEGYMGTLVIPEKVVETAASESLLINFFTPREKILQAILKTYPGLKAENIHVWTLRGKSREKRIGDLWKEWLNLGVNLVEDGWRLPSGFAAFTDSGTYSPTFLVGVHDFPDGEKHLFMVDGYAASAEAIQAASLYPILNLHIPLAVFTSRFERSYRLEPEIMRLDPDTEDFISRLEEIFGKAVGEEKAEVYRESILQAREAGIPLDKKVILADDFLPEKDWEVMAISGYMLPDPYSGIQGVEKVDDETYKVSVRFTTSRADKITTLTFRLLEDRRESRLVFNPLLNRFMRGEDYRKRPVKISDSGRIRNELQTLCSEALEHVENGLIRIHFDRIPEDVILPDDQKILREVLEWYKRNHPLWFKWLEME